MATWKQTKTAVLATLAIIVAACSSEQTGDNGGAVPEPVTPDSPSTTVEIPSESDTSAQAAPADNSIVPSAPSPIDSYDAALELALSQSFRNTNLDDSQFVNTPIEELPQEQLLGPRSDYLGFPNGNPEQAFPISDGGQARNACEFSHFGYNDPVVFPGQEGVAHLHMFFGNTHVNGYTDTDTLFESGSGTCNGQELNRTGYWVPAMFDANGNVRIPERIVVYYKGEGLANGGRNPAFPDGTENPGAQPFVRGMRNLSPQSPTVPEIPGFDGGAEGEVNWKCTDNWSGANQSTGVENIPICDGSFHENNGAQFPTTRTVLEMEVKFFNCFPADALASGQVEDHTLWEAAGPSRGSWFFGNCGGRGGQDPSVAPPLDDKVAFANVSYFVNYALAPGETTEGWHLASDVDPATLADVQPRLVEAGPGSTHHGDFFPAWHPPTFEALLENCVNFANVPIKDADGNLVLDENGRETREPSGCGFGYLSDGGPDNENPLPGPALRYREQWDRPEMWIESAPLQENLEAMRWAIPAEQVFSELCVPHGPTHSFEVPEHAAWCLVGDHGSHGHAPVR